MYKSNRSAPLFAEIQIKIDEVVRLLCAEVNAHPHESWPVVCKRVGPSAHVSISIFESLLDWNSPDNWVLEPRKPHGNTHFKKAIEEGYVAITSLSQGWGHLFRLVDWSFTNNADHRNGLRQASPISFPVAAINLEGRSQRPSTASSPDHNDETNDRPEEKLANKTLRRKEYSVTPVYNETYLIREFDRRERERGPIFAGFIVNDLLPRLGFDSSEAKRILRAMEAQNMVRTERKPNPKDPDRSTTYVSLNREHPHVARVLKGAAGVERTFPIGTIKGELLSERIIRERL